MKKLILIALVVFGGMKVYEHFQPNLAHAQNDFSLSTLVGDNNIQPKRIESARFPWRLVGLSQAAMAA